MANRKNLNEKVLLSTHNMFQLMDKETYHKYTLKKFLIWLYDQYNNNKSTETLKINPDLRITCGCLYRVVSVASILKLNNAYFHRPRVDISHEFSCLVPGANILSHSQSKVVTFPPNFIYICVSLKKTINSFKPNGISHSY